MMKAPIKPGFLDSPRTQSKIRGGFYVFLIILLAVDLFVPKHGHFPWEDAPGFYAAYGFIGCISLIFIAKVLRFIVKRKEGYYD